MNRIFCLLLLSYRACALPLEVTFNTDPPHLQVYNVVYDRGASYLGESGQPLLLNLEPSQKLRLFFAYKPPNAPAETDRQLFNIDPNDLTVTERDQQGSPLKARYPNAGMLAVQLLASEQSALEADRRPAFLRQRRFFTGLLALAACAGIVGLMVYKRRQDAVLARAETLLDLNTRVDQRDAFQGKIFGSYRVLDKLGSGGMATVYRAVPEQSLDESQAVALKVLHSNEPEILERLRREIEVCKSLQHPNIVRFMEANIEADRVYLVMELIRGATLRASLQEKGLPAAAALQLLEPVMKALIYAHARGVVHRDLKPDNIMVSARDGRVVLMDFGLARRHDLATLTNTGSLLGTPAYISPEQVQGQYCPASDQYALGVMAFELLTGRLPFPAQDPLQLIMAHIQQEPPRLCQVKASLPARLEPVVMRMLAKKPEDRYPSVEILLAAWKEAVPR